MQLVLKESSMQMVVLFAIIALGYIIGSVHVKGVNLGTAAVFLSGLLFGYLGAETSSVLQTIGLLLFITSVALSAGPTFFQRMRSSGRAYLVLCLTVAAAGALVCGAVIRLGGVDAPLAVGMMTGAFTTSPGFAAAKEVVAGSTEAVNRVAAGYGIIYPVGVVCKVLFIQLVPRALHANMEQERKLIAAGQIRDGGPAVKRMRLEPWGLLPFSLAVAAGIVLGAVSVPLPGGGAFSLGTTGGPLIMGLVIGQIGHIGKIDLRPDPKLYGPVKEIGLILFLANAGVEGGHGLAEILSTYGAVLLLYGFLLVTIPLAVGFLMFWKVLRLPLLNGLGSMSASMTCTPSLAVLIQTAGTDDVVSAYATTYPIALITLVLLVQVLVRL